MGSTSRYGRARINPSAPEAVGVCDGCGKLWNLRELRFQFDWAGVGMINRQIRVCPDCYDAPQEQLRTIILPPDPPPVWQPRVEPYAVDETNDYTLRAPIGKPAMFEGGAGSVTASLTFGSNLLAVLTALSSFDAEVLLGVGLTASLGDVSDMSASVALGMTMTASLGDVSDMSAELTQLAPVTRTATHDFTFAIGNTVGSNIFTETAAPIGTAAADRLVVVCVTGSISDNDNQVNSVTIGGVTATLGVERYSTAEQILAQIWYANVPTGTTADIVLSSPNPSSFFDSYNTSVYAIYGANISSPVQTTNTDFVASGDVSVSVSPNANTVTIAAALTGFSNAATTSTITNATEDFDISTDFTFFHMNMVSGSRVDATAPGSVSITATSALQDAATTKSMAVAVFQQ